VEIGGSASLWKSVDLLPPWKSVDLLDTVQPE